MKESITNQVYELRTKAEVTQEKLADTVGVTRQTIIAIEKGNYTPSVVLALKIAKFFKKSVEDIFQIKYDPSTKTRGHGE
ncbi:MAG: putative transcriptional regulator [Parcubacteria group bacterium Gr01-1014_70]|nr:MAG: putative transcriptional regulator [Parcubacteria group bacterium Gr01-1014_70]